MPSTAVFGYLLRPGETSVQAAQRLGAPPGSERAVSDGCLEFAVALEGTDPRDGKWESAVDAEIRRRFPKARIDGSASNGVRSIQVQTDEETFDVTVRGARLFVTTFDGFGGVDALTANNFAGAFERAYDAYRAVLSARRL